MINPLLNHLDHAAARASSDTFFIGHLLTVMIDSGRMTRPEFAATLKCDESQLPRLWLCRAPAGAADAFRQDVERIANFIGCDSVELAKLVRESAAVRALELVKTDFSQSMLLAARDRLNDPPKPGAADA